MRLFGLSRWLVVFVTSSVMASSCVAVQSYRPYNAEATQRHALALNNLGWLYAHGQGVPSRPVVAYALYTISADMEPPASKNAGRIKTGAGIAMSNAR